MNKPLALIYAVLGTALLATISFFMATGQPWLATLAAIVSLLFIGSGFIVKARQRRKREQSAAEAEK
jgi:hypothetical protein